LRQRLQKILSAAGVASRRKAEELIRMGRVTVDGKRAQLGDKADPENQVVAVDGVPVPGISPRASYAVNKPAGYICSRSDSFGRPLVTELVPGTAGLYPAGRLDLDAEGLVILTNDGLLAQIVTHPSFGVEKEYLVEVDPDPSSLLLRALVRGVELEDGLARAVSARKIGPGAVRLVMVEGKKREVKRMLAALGLRTVRLVRVRIGPVRLGGLAPGAWRPLSFKEIKELYRLAGQGAGHLPPLD
jgi:23S rRNA pseudouridine2605 synthase